MRRVPTTALKLFSSIRFISLDSLPTTGALRTPGKPKEESEGEDSGLYDENEMAKETWSQFASRMRQGRRRIRTVDIASRVSYEYRSLKILCKKKPTMRQWAVRNDFCVMDPGVVFMSPAMQSAFMRVFRLKNKGEVRAALRDIIPVIMYRNSFDQIPEKHFDPQEMIPEGEAETLNQKKRELFERKAKLDKYKDSVLRDEKAQSRLRAQVRKKLTKFQKRIMVNNVIASRTILYNENDALGYFLFRGPAMYAALHRVFFELSKLLPHFVPKTMLDFGCGTGTAIIVAKEVYDPGSLSQPIYRNMRQSMQHNFSSKSYQMEELQYDLKRLQRNNMEKKRARFLAVSALLENGEIDPEDLPKDLLKEIVTVSKAAAFTSEKRINLEKLQGRHRDLLDGKEWDPNQDATGEHSNEEEYEDTGNDEFNQGSSPQQPKTWWQQYVDEETGSIAKKLATHRRLQPLQSITAIEPSPGMMEVAMVALAEDAQNVQWKRYLMPEDVSTEQQHDLVVVAYTLSEIATPEARKRAIRDLWKTTRGVLVLVEHATLQNFNILMEARDAILEEKGVGMWDWQPTILGPCPHEKNCPMRYSRMGIKRKKMRVCSVDVDYRSTFIDMWAREEKFKVGYESVSYLILARNEIVPARAETRKEELRKEALKEKAERDRKQRELYEASLSTKDLVFERLSEEALHRPGTDLTLPSSTSEGKEIDGPGKSFSNPIAVSDSDIGISNANSIIPIETPRYERAGVGKVNRLVMPSTLTVPKHRYNRGYVDGAYQSSRPLTPGEMITIKGEVSIIRQHYLKEIFKYSRNVRHPIIRSKAIATLCTPDGDLVTGKVYKYQFSSAKKRHSTSRWTHIGGFGLLRRSRPGDLFPHNVPLYGIKKLDQTSVANTLIDVRRSPLEMTSLQEGGVDLEALDPSTMNDEQYRVYTRLKEEKQSLEYADEFIASTAYGSNSVSTDESKEMIAKLDAKAEMTAIDWARVVEAAKRNAREHFRRLHQGKPGAPMSKRRRQAARSKGQKTGKY
eukprot:Tbor_TRINITY_DN2902_c0_g1::TRINITY_DN2902_c0_g1_i1::g.1043::m.1043